MVQRPISEYGRRRFLRLISGGVLIGAVGRQWAGLALAASVRRADLQVRGTPLFRRGALGLRQMLVAEIADPDFARGSIEITGSGGTRFDVASLQTHDTGEGGIVYVPIVPVEQDQRLEVVYRRNATRWVTHVELEPQRRWELYVVHNSHQDPGYEALPSEMRARFPAFLDEALEYIEATSDRDPSDRFRWNVEVSYLLDDYRQARGDEALDHLIERLRDGSMELGALYCSVQTDVLGPEVLHRSVTDATQRLAAEFGIQVKAAILDDVPGFAWGLPDVMAGAGVRYLLWGGNPIRSNLHPGVTPPLFWIEGPAGGRVLVWRSKDYVEGIALIDTSYAEDGLARPAALVQSLLGRYERGGYPFKEVLIQAAGDFVRPRRQVSDFVASWNASWAYPHFRVAGLSEFFEVVEAEHGDAIPALHGGFPDAWNDLRNTMAAGASRARALNSLLPAVETWVTLASASGSPIDPQRRLDQAYRHLLLYAEHTVGWEAGRHDIYRDESEGGGRRHYEEKVAHLDAAEGVVAELQADALGELGSRITAGPGSHVLVWNPLLWSRTETVSIPETVIAKALGSTDIDPFSLRDGSSGESIPHQVVEREGGDRVVVAQVADVPSVGYRSIEILPRESEQEGGGFSRDNFAIYGNYYEVHVDPRTGAISSVVDLELGRQLVDPQAPHLLNQFVQILSKQRSKVDFELVAEATTTGVRPSSSPAMSGPIAASLRYCSSVGSLIDVEQEIVLFSQLKRIDLITTIRKRVNYSKEGLYLAFPFALEGRWEYARFRSPIELSIAGGWMRPDLDQLPGSTRDNYVASDGVLCSDGKTAVAWVSHDAPVVQLGGIQSNRFLSSLTSNGGENLLENAWLYSSLLHNYWYTNAPIAQAGELTFRYSMTSFPDVGSRLKAKRFGMQELTPMQATVATAGSEGWDPVAGMLRCGAPNVALTTLKRPFESDGDVVLRVAEIEGLQTDTWIEFDIPGRRAVGAWRCDVNERPLQPLAMNGTRIPIRLARSETATVKIALADSSHSRNIADVVAP